MSRALKNIAVFGIITSYNSLFQERVLDVASTNGITRPPTPTLIALNQHFVDLENATGAGLSTLDDYVWFGLNNSALWPFSLISWKRTGVIWTAQGGIASTAYGWKNNMLNGYLVPNLTPNGSGNYKLNNAGKFSTIYEGSGSAVAVHNLIDGRLGSDTVDVWYVMNGNYQRINQTSGNLNSAADLTGTGFKSINRESSTNVRLENKDVVMNRTATSTSLFASEITIGRRSTVDSSNISGLGYTNWGIGAALNNTQTQAIRTSVNTLLSNVGLTPIA
ncbi:MAG: hypothetical protein ITG00_00150 [Flavobacterium sp.]|nr:hypothetical protein [Flavobacterium sp.]